MSVWKINLKKRNFKLFNLNRDGKGVYEIEDRTPTFVFFQNFSSANSRNLSSNVLMLLR